MGLLRRSSTERVPSCRRLSARVKRTDASFLGKILQENTNKISYDTPRG